MFLKEDTHTHAVTHKQSHSYCHRNTKSCRIIK